jgi:hypothetical protein
VINESHVHDHDLEQAMFDLAWLKSINHDEYENAGETLFALLCRGAMVYMRGWAEQAPMGTLADMNVDDHDLNDPSRIVDPNARMSTLIDMFLEALRDNITPDLKVTPP